LSNRSTGGSTRLSSAYKIFYSGKAAADRDRAPSRTARYAARAPRAHDRASIDPAASPGAIKSAAARVPSRRRIKRRPIALPRAARYARTPIPERSRVTPERSDVTRERFDVTSI
jgi:hypothetical protein